MTERLLLKAVAVEATEAGEFEAVVSSSVEDREKDIVSTQGVVDALRAWVPRRVPLVWHHSSRPEDNIGYIDPATAKIVGNEVLVKGWIDRSIERGREAWRLCKTGTLGFSFGYLVQKARPRVGGGRMLDSIDLFGVSAVGVGAMQSRTRVLSWKAQEVIGPPRRRVAPSLDELEAHRLAVEGELALDGLDLEAINAVEITIDDKAIFPSVEEVRDHARLVEWDVAVDGSNYELQAQARSEMLAALDSE